MKDILREYTKTVNHLLSLFPCVAVLGARQIGKTTLLKQVFPNNLIYDLEKSSDFELISDDPLFFLHNHSQPIIIDEAQLCPELFKALRVKIDDNRNKPGQFLISGSSSPELMKSISESLAGRIAIVELGGLLWSEALQKTISMIYQLIEKQQYDKFFDLKKNYSLDELYVLCLYGGYPEPYLNRNRYKFYEIWVENYLQTYINRDIRRLFPGLNTINYSRFIRMMSFSSGESINISNFSRSLDVSQPTARQYFEIAHGTFIWRILPSFHKSGKKRLIKMSKGYIRDSGLTASFQNIKNVEMLKIYPRFGLIWEVFVIEQIIKSLGALLIQANPYYYRTADHSEVDLVLEGKFGLLPIEIKTGFYRGKKQIQGLINFINDYNCPYGILINNDDRIDRISEKVYQIPAIYW
jgi:predicted AAA+ superfamily ATPase